MSLKETVDLIIASCSLSNQHQSFLTVHESSLSCFQLPKVVPVYFGKSDTDHLVYREVKSHHP